MPRSLRIEYPGAYYHVMARCNRHEAIFRDEDDRRFFLKTLGEACGMTGWRVHAWVLMGNHYHLMIETPEANLVVGMGWLQNAYTRRYNTRHRLWGGCSGIATRRCWPRGEALVDPHLARVLASRAFMKIQRALISVSDEDGIVAFARKLVKLGVEIVSTGGTAALLGKQTPSLPDARPHSERFRRGRRESEFLQDSLIPIQLCPTTPAG